MKQKWGYGEGLVNSSARQAWEPQLHALMSGWCVQSQPLAVRLRKQAGCSQRVWNVVCFVQGWPTKGWLKVEGGDWHLILSVLCPPRTHCSTSTQTHRHTSNTKHKHTWIKTQNKTNQNSRHGKSFNPPIGLPSGMVIKFWGSSTMLLTNIRLDSTLNQPLMSSFSVAAAWLSSVSCCACIT